MEIKRTQTSPKSVDGNSKGKNKGSPERVLHMKTEVIEVKIQKPEAFYVLNRSPFKISEFGIPVKSLLWKILVPLTDNHPGSPFYAGPKDLTIKKK